jgi:hypothetical protein
MKKLFYLFGLTAMIFAACSKEKNINPIDIASQNDLANIRVISYNNGLKSGVSLLEFPSVTAYESAINTLIRRMDDYNSAFYAQYGNLSEEAYDAKQTELGYDDQQPLVQFETSLNFSNSMRQVYNTVENSWLNQSTLNIGTYPKIAYPYSLAEMTLLNSNGEVKIGVAILKLTKNGFIWITDGSLPTLIKINNGDMSTLNLPNVMSNINESSSSGDCKSWKAKEMEDTYVVNSKKVIKHVHFHAYPWKGTGSAEITSYKKNSHGNWRKYAIDLGVSDQTNFHNSDCNLYKQIWSGWKRKHIKSIEQNNSFWGTFPAIRAKNGASVYGGFEYGSFANSIVLTW